MVGLVATADGDDDAASASANSGAVPPETTVSSDAATSAVGSAAPAEARPADSGVTDPASSSETSAPVTTDPDTPDLPNLGPHPEFLPVQEWLQTDARSFDEFDGKVVAVQFWTFGCNNCQATFPHMRDLYSKYAGENFEIVGVHAPEFDFERDVNSVAAAAEENGLSWPIAIDNDKLNFRSWQDRRFWPRIILIDVDGNMRYDHIGEGAYDEIDAAVGALIAEGTA